MIPAIGAVGKPEESATPVVRPMSELLRADPVKAAQAASPSIAPPAPLHLSGEDNDIDDELLYTSTTKTIAPTTGPGSVSIPGIGVFPGLVEQNSSTSEVRYEIRMGGVLVARVYQNGVTETASGFDLSRLGFPSPEERDMTGQEMADYRLAKLSDYFSTLHVPFDIFDKDGNQVSLDRDNRPVVARPFAAGAEPQAG